MAAHLRMLRINLSLQRPLQPDASAARRDTIPNLAQRLGLFVGEGLTGAQMPADAIDESALPIVEARFARLAVFDQLKMIFHGHPLGLHCHVLLSISMRSHGRTVCTRFLGFALTSGSTT